MTADNGKRFSENRSPIGGRAVFVWGLLAVLGVGCRDATQPATPTASESGPTQHPSQMVEQGYFEYTERGEVVQSLQAASLELWESDDEDPESLWHVDGGFTLFIGGTRERHSARLSAIRGRTMTRWGNSKPGMKWCWSTTLERGRDRTFDLVPRFRPREDQPTYRNSNASGHSSGQRAQGRQPVRALHHLGPHRFLRFGRGLRA